MSSFPSPSNRGTPDRRAWFPARVVSLLIAGLWLIVAAVPGFTVAVRRLHDSNQDGGLAIAPPGPFILLLLAIRRPRAEGVRFDT